MARRAAIARQKVSAVPSRRAEPSFALTSLLTGTKTRMAPARRFTADAYGCILVRDSGAPPLFTEMSLLDRGARERRSQRERAETVGAVVALKAGQRLGLDQPREVRRHTTGPLRAASPIGDRSLSCREMRRARFSIRNCRKQFGQIGTQSNS